MCGVVGIVYEKLNEQLGREAAVLLKKLEYRGYDSTGAAFFGDDGSVVLKKRVGSPTAVTRDLEIERDRGVKFIGQVRWATYGSVTDLNAQPHELRCRCHVVGAHNGNISNTDSIKEYLLDNGHDVISDNDGEMLVHEVEHYYDQLTRRRVPRDDEERVGVTIAAIRKAQLRVEGSYAACVAFPDLPGIFAMKSGSSLYAGKGSDANGDFVLVSSDLTSVLSKTRFLIPLAEGQGIYFTHDDYRVFSLHGEREFRPKLRRSRLNVSDISLDSRYRYFMHQEIYTAAENIDRLLKYYFLDEGEAELFEVLETHKAGCKDVISRLLELYDVFEADELVRRWNALLEDETYQQIESAVEQCCGPLPAPRRPLPFTSDEAQLLDELLEIDKGRYRSLWLLDQIVIWKKKRKVTRYRDEMTALIRQAGQDAGRVFAIGAGTSFHASLVGAYLFNGIAQLAILPVNPGMFRSMYFDSLRPGDILLGVTQSGETKDLLDIFNDVRARYGADVKLVSMVNNELSSIPQEKSDFFLPILCGPEVAVAATKSFISQVALFHLLACSAVRSPDEVRDEIAKVRTVIEFTLRAVEVDTDEVALKLFLKPSIHILGTSLIGIAKEGALKIREVVLNHTEGYDSAEFKHGPNTILGKNTIFSLTDMERLLVDAFDLFGSLCDAQARGEIADAGQLGGLMDMFKDIRFQDIQMGSGPADTGRTLAINQWVDRYKEHVNLERYFDNYPLIFVCPPEERDTKITISQIHTHKIRGSDIVLIAQDDEDLRKAVEGAPAEGQDYYAKYIRVPRMFDRHMFVYQAAVVLQLLALKMSVDKMKYLNRLHVENHGVHPDVPKNVSKSITVD